MNSEQQHQENEIKELKKPTVPKKRVVPTKQDSKHELQKIGMKVEEQGSFITRHKVDNFLCKS